LFKSRPKSDRRLEWKSLKASHAKALTAAKIKVEIGLGKELDSFQKQIDKVLALDESQLTKDSLAPVVAAGKNVKKHIATLKPKVKAYDNLTKFLTGLEKDVAWWEKAAGNVTLPEVNRGGWEPGAVREATEALLKAKPLMDKMDTLLSKALKPKGVYDPPREIDYWVRDSKLIKAGITKLSVASKKSEGRHELVRELLVGLKEPLGDMRWYLSTMARYNLGDLDPKVADWAAVKKLASDLNNHIDDASRVAGGLK
jgi:hypothetical protein